MSTFELPKTLSDYDRLEEAMHQMTQAEIMNLSWIMAREDLYFLLRYVLSTKEFFKPGKDGIISYQWILDRCREVQNDSHRTLDVWSRFHWKSNIKTFANVIRHILIDPNITIAILSHTRPNAKKFLAQIQREITTNKLLQKLSWHPTLEGQAFPDFAKDLERNSLDEGIIVNRTGNPKEPTLMATGLVDSLEVGPHYHILCYDDVVTKDSVTSPDMIKKTTEAWELSLMLRMPNTQFWYTGTFYSYDDTYTELIRRGIRPRVHPCYELDHDNCIVDPDTGGYHKMAWHFDRPVLYEKPHLDELFSDVVGRDGPKTANMQLLCDPSAGLRSGFELEDMRFYAENPYKEREDKNVYILVDPANEKKKNSDYTAMFVVGAGNDKNLVVLDMVRDRLNLQERTEKLFELHRRWRPIEVRYERYGLQADVQHIQYVQGLMRYRFHITEVAGNVRKDDRIERLVPLFKDHRIYFPRECWYVDTSGDRKDLVRAFMEEEFNTWPNSSYKDMLDSLSRIAEPDLPVIYPISHTYSKEAWAKDRREKRYGNYSPPPEPSWMGA